MMCPCGKPLHYAHPEIRRQVELVIKKLGATQKVTVGAQSWMVPRHYLALHGLKIEEFADIALRYDFKEI